MAVRIRVIGGVGDLASDLEEITVISARDMADTVKNNADDGMRYARSFARQSAGAHGVHYPKSITTEQLAPFRWEYGPDAAMPQGGMSFEGGSRNQPPHLDMAKSADLIAPRFARDVAKLPDRWFW